MKFVAVELKLDPYICLFTAGFSQPDAHRAPQRGGPLACAMSRASRTPLPDLTARHTTAMLARRGEVGGGVERLVEPSVASLEIRRAGE